MQIKMPLCIKLASRRAFGGKRAYCFKIKGAG